MARPQQLSDPDEETEINLSPMIDCIFILLIFFIVTTVFVEEPGVEIQKPIAAGAEQLEKNSILVAITADNKIIYGGKEFSVAGLGARIKQLLLREDYPIIIQADQQADQGIFSQVLNEAKLAGANRISFSTQN